MLLQKINKRSGFTLIELMVVVAIVAILAAIVVPITVGILENVNVKSDQVEIVDQDGEPVESETPEPAKEEEDKL